MSDSRRQVIAAARLSGLTKRYPGFQLGPLELMLEAGTVLALVGPNGAGKTTALNCMAGLLVPDEGGTEVFGAPVHPTRTEYRRDVGYVGEQSGFFQRWSARRNLAYLAKALPGWSDDRARRLVERFGLPLDKPVNKLSRGNRTKLALVAALAHGPRLLLLDEPTAGLDPVVRTEVLDVLWEITEDGGHAVLYSTHILSDISRLADELAFLRAGRIVLRSGRDELGERWRRVSFRLHDEDLELAGVVQHRRVRAEHQVITRDAETTLEQLAELGAEAVEVSRLSVDEIAVQILKEGIMWHALRTELAYFRPWLFGGLGVAAGVVIIVSLVFSSVGEDGPPGHVAAGIRGMFLMMGPLIVGFIVQSYRNEERRSRLLLAGPLTPRQMAGISVLLPVILFGVGVLAAALMLGVEAVLTGRLAPETLNIVGYVGGMIFMGLMIGLLVQEAIAAYREGRLRAAAGGWASFGVGLLLLAILTTVVVYVQGPSSWPGLHLGNLVVAILAMLATVVLYMGRTDFTR